MNTSPLPAPRQLPTGSQDKLLDSKIQDVIASFAVRSWLNSTNSSRHAVVESKKEPNRTLYHLKQSKFSSEQDYIKSLEYYRRLEAYSKAMPQNTNTVKLKQLYDFKDSNSRFYEIVTVFDYGEQLKELVWDIPPHRVVGFVRELSVELNYMHDKFKITPGNISWKHVWSIGNELKLAGLKPMTTKGNSNYPWRKDFMRIYGEDRLQTFMIGLLLLEYMRVDLSFLKDKNLSLQMLLSKTKQIAMSLKQSTLRDLLLKIVDAENGKDYGLTQLTSSFSSGNSVEIERALMEMQQLNNKTMPSQQQLQQKYQASPATVKIDQTNNQLRSTQLNTGVIGQVNQQIYGKQPQGLPNETRPINIPNQSGLNNGQQTNTPYRREVSNSPVVYVQPNQTFVERIPVQQINQPSLTNSGIQTKFPLSPRQPMASSYLNGQPKLIDSRPISPNNGQPGVVNKDTFGLNRLDVRNYAPIPIQANNLNQQPPNSPYLNPNSFQMGQPIVNSQSQTVRPLPMAQTANKLNGIPQSNNQQLGQWSFAMPNTTHLNPTTYPLSQNQLNDNNSRTVPTNRLPTSNTPINMTPGQNYNGGIKIYQARPQNVNVNNRLPITQPIQTGLRNQSPNPQANPLGPPLMTYPNISSPSSLNNSSIQKTFSNNGSQFKINLTESNVQGTRTVPIINDGTQGVRTNMLYKSNISPLNVQSPVLAQNGQGFLLQSGIQTSPNLNSNGVNRQQVAYQFAQGRTNTEKVEPSEVQNRLIVQNSNAKNQTVVNSNINLTLQKFQANGNQANLGTTIDLKTVQSKRDFNYVQFAVPDELTNETEIPMQNKQDRRSSHQVKNQGPSSNWSGQNGIKSDQQKEPKEDKKATKKLASQNLNLIVEQATDKLVSDSKRSHNGIDSAHIPKEIKKKDSHIQRKSQGKHPQSSFSGKEAKIENEKQHNTSDDKSYKFDKKAKNAYHLQAEPSKSRSKINWPHDSESRENEIKETKSKHKDPVPHNGLLAVVQNTSQNIKSSSSRKAISNFKNLVFNAMDQIHTDPSRRWGEALRAGDKSINGVRDERQLKASSRRRIMLGFQNVVNAAQQVANQNRANAISNGQNGFENQVQGPVVVNAISQVSQTQSNNFNNSGVMAQSGVLEAQRRSLSPHPGMNSQNQNTRNAHIQMENQRGNNSNERSTSTLRESIQNVQKAKLKVTETKSHQIESEDNHLKVTKESITIKKESSQKLITTQTESQTPLIQTEKLRNSRGNSMTVHNEKNNLFPPKESSQMENSKRKLSVKKIDQHSSSNSRLTSLTVESKSGQRQSQIHQADLTPKPSNIQANFDINNKKTGKIKFETDFNYRGDPTLIGELAIQRDAAPNGRISRNSDSKAKTKEESQFAIARQLRKDTSGVQNKRHYQFKLMSHFNMKNVLMDASFKFASHFQPPNHNQQASKTAGVRLVLKQISKKNMKNLIKESTEIYTRKRYNERKRESLKLEMSGSKKNEARLSSDRRSSSKRETMYDEALNEYMRYLYREYEDIDTNILSSKTKQSNMGSLNVDYRLTGKSTNSGKGSIRHSTGDNSERTGKYLSFGGGLHLIQDNKTSNSRSNNSGVDGHESNTQLQHVQDPSIGQEENTEHLSQDTTPKKYKGNQGSLYVGYSHKQGNDHTIGKNGSQRFAEPTSKKGSKDPKKYKGNQGSLYVSSQKDQSVTSIIKSTSSKKFLVQKEQSKSHLNVFEKSHVESVKAISRTESQKSTKIEYIEVGTTSIRSHVKLNTSTRHSEYQEENSRHEVSKRHVANLSARESVQLRVSRQNIPLTSGKDLIKKSARGVMVSSKQTTTIQRDVSQTKAIKSSANVQNQSKTPTKQARASKTPELNKTDVKNDAIKRKSEVSKTPVKRESEVSKTPVKRESEVKPQLVSQAQVKRESMVKKNENTKVSSRGVLTSPSNINSSSNSKREAIGKIASTRSNALNQTLTMPNPLQRPLASNKKVTAQKTPKIVVENAEEVIPDSKSNKSNGKLATLSQNNSQSSLHKQGSRNVSQEKKGHSRDNSVSKLTVSSKRQGIDSMRVASKKDMDVSMNESEFELDDVSDYELDVIKQDLEKEVWPSEQKLDEMLVLDEEDEENAEDSDSILDNEFDDEEDLFLSDELDSEEPELKSHISKARKILKKYGSDAAIKYLEKIKGRFGHIGMIEISRLIGVLHFRSKRYDLARKNLEWGWNLYKTHFKSDYKPRLYSRLLGHLALSEFKLKRYSVALGYLEDSTFKIPTYQPKYYNLLRGHLYYHSKSYDKARQFYFDHMNAQYRQRGYYGSHWRGNFFLIKRVLKGYAWNKDRVNPKLYYRSLLPFLKKPPTVPEGFKFDHKLFLRYPPKLLLNFIRYGRDLKDYEFNREILNFSKNTETVETIHHLSRRDKTEFKQCMAEARKPAKGPALSDEEIDYYDEIDRKLNTDDGELGEESPEEKFKKLALRIHLALENNQPDRAIGYLDHLIKALALIDTARNTEQYRTCLDFGKQLVKFKRDSEAITFYERLIKNDCSDPVLYAKARRKIGKINFKIAHFSECFRWSRMYLTDYLFKQPPSNHDYKQMNLVCQLIISAFKTKISETSWLKALFTERIRAHSMLYLARYLDLFDGFRNGKPPVKMITQEESLRKETSKILSNPKFNKQTKITKLLPICSSLATIFFDEKHSSQSAFLDSLIDAEMPLNSNVVHVSAFIMNFLEMWAHTLPDQAKDFSLSNFKHELLSVIKSLRKYPHLNDTIRDSIRNLKGTPREAWIDKVKYKSSEHTISGISSKKRNSSILTNKPLLPPKNPPAEQELKIPVKKPLVRKSVI